MSSTVRSSVVLSLFSSKTKTTFACKQTKRHKILVAGCIVKCDSATVPGIVVLIHDLSPDLSTAGLSISMVDGSTGYGYT